MKRKIDHYDKKIVAGVGGFILRSSFVSWKDSAFYIPETGGLDTDRNVDILYDRSIAYHSSTLNISRHLFYQPELSDVWFSIAALEQNIKLICIDHPSGWLMETSENPGPAGWDQDNENNRSFLIRSYFRSTVTETKESEPFDINTYFDRIFIINLDRRTERWEKTLRIAGKHNLKVTRFSAVDGYTEPFRSEWERYSKSAFQLLPEGISPLMDYKDKFLKYHHYIARIHFIESKLGRKTIQSPGAWGVLLSYIEILKTAIREELNRILIFEDDIVLHNSFDIKIKECLNLMPISWKIFMLGAMQHHWDPWITWVNDSLYHCNGSSTAAHATGFNRKVFLQMLFYAEKMDLPVDEGSFFHIKNIYNKDCFIAFPNLAIQEMKDSDINSSAMKSDDILNWKQRFRWDPNDYEYDED